MSKKNPHFRVLFCIKHFFSQIEPKNTPKCYTWLESYGYAVYDGKKKEIFFHPVKRQIFGDASGKTSALILTACHKHFRREQEDQVEVGKELMKQEFTEWLNQVIASLVTETYSVIALQVEMVAVESAMPEMHFGEIREFHR